MRCGVGHEGEVEDGELDQLAYSTLLENACGLGKGYKLIGAVPAWRG